MNQSLIQQTDTAIHSFHSASTQKVVKGINNRIFAYLQIVGRATRNEIKEALGITDRQCSCGCSHLITQRKIRVCDTKVNLKTNHPIQVLEINDTPEIAFKKMSNAEKLKEIKAICEKFSLGEKDRLTVDILQIINS